jgi:hypothetical protein
MKDGGDRRLRRHREDAAVLPHAHHREPTSSR